LDEKRPFAWKAAFPGEIMSGRMPKENLEIVRRSFVAFQAALARDDPGAWFDSEAIAADAEWVMFPGFPGPPSYRGGDGFVEFLRTWTEDFEDWSIELERLIDAGDDRVVALFRQTATGKGSGVPVELHFGQVQELKDSRVNRIRNYPDPAEALKAAGLPG
jgi:ketosteroid isomerase-like protein